MNDAGTRKESDTPMTQDRSAFDPAEARRQLIAKRVAAGADSEIGHRCSNLIEQLGNLATATGAQRANLIKLMEASMRDLHARHQ